MDDITRRRFVTLGAQGMALAAIPGFLRFNPTAAFAQPTGDGSTLSNYYTHFGVDEQVIRKVMQAALSHGGDYCDVYFQHSKTNYVVLEDNIVSRAYTSVDLGVGIRVLKGDQTGYSFTEEVSPEAMTLAAKTAANIATGGSGTVPVSLQFNETPDLYPIEMSWSEIGIDQKIPILQAINDKMAALDDRILKARVIFSDGGSDIMVATSEGRISCDYQPMSQITSVCTMQIGEQRETARYTVSGRHGLEHYTPEVLDRLATEAVQRATVMFEAVKPDAGEMPVVLAAGKSGILLHEAIGHGMEADFNRKNESVYADKIGHKIAEPFVNIIDDGTNLNVRGSINVDDEGNDTQKTTLVENGILKTYMHDRISAQHYNVATTGSGRRQSFRHPPMPRMRNTYMANGPHTREEIIASVKKGVYAESFTNGEVRIGPGDFTFYVKSGTLIEDGKLTAPVKDINLIGNGPKVLENVTMVANDFKLDEGGWTCGKNGQSVPVSLGLPTILVSAITVGGVNRSQKPAGNA